MPTIVERCDQLQVKIDKALRQDVTFNRKKKKEPSSDEIYDEAYSKAINGAKDAKKKKSSSLDEGVKKYAKESAAKDAQV